MEGNKNGPEIRREQNWISDKAGNEDGSEKRRGTKIDQTRGRGTKIDQRRRGEQR